MGQLSTEMTKLSEMEKLMLNLKPPQYEDIQLTDEEVTEALFAGRKVKARRLMLASYSVKLDEKETLEALRKGREKKQGLINEVEYAKRVYRPKEVTYYDATQLAHKVIEDASSKVRSIKGKSDAQYKVTLHNRQILWKLCLYFSNDQRFESDDLSLSKGIMLVGPPGCGKTFMMSLFQKNQKQSYITVGCQSIGREFAKSGFDIIEHYSKPLYGIENFYGHTEYGICLDDLGADEKRKHYGDQANAVADIIDGRYKWGRHGMTHITSNIDGNQIEEDYGVRIRSRISEMFNFIYFSSEAPDMRKL